MLTTLARLLLVVMALLLSSCVDNDRTPVTTRYFKAVTDVMQRYHIPGVQVSVRYPGDDEWKESFGYSNLAQRTPIDPQSHFPIRSVTKSYTVTVVLQLVHDQLLSLDDKLEKYVPGIPNGNLISIADLAGMQSGIADYSSSDAFRARFGDDPAAPFTEQQLVDFAIPLSPVFAPGEQYQYSNTNTVLLGMIVEKVTQLSLATALRTRIFAPLALAGTHYPDAIALPLPHPTPYEVDINTGVTEELPLINPQSLAGAGAMISTLDDLQAWALALGDGRLIGAELQQQRIDRSRVVTSGPEYDRYGLGIGILKGWIGHTGSGVGWQLATFYDPRSQATIAVMVNATPAGGRTDLNFAQEVFEALAEVVATH